MKNIFRNTRGYRWWPDADAVNAPEGALLRADNLIPDPEAQLALRPGSFQKFTGLEPRVHSLYTCLLNGEKFNFAGCNDKLFRNGVDFGENFAGGGGRDEDLAIGDDAYQAFFCRSTTKKKFDGINFHNYGIAAPEFPATLTAVPAITSTVASFATAESPAFVINEGTSAFVTGHDAVASGALQLVPNPSSGRASASKVFASDQNYLDIQGSKGNETDLFDIFVWMSEPRNVDKITIMFGMGTGSDAYKDDYFYFDFPIKDAGTVDIKDPRSSGAASYSIYADRVQSVLSPNEVTDIKSPDQVAAILRRLGRFAGARSRERKDSQEASPAWTHLSVTRGQFNRVGGTAGRDWTTIRAFKVVYSVRPGATSDAYFDSAVWTGGGNRSLTGRFQLGYRFVRNFGDHYFEMSPISPISEPIDLTQQALQVTIPAQALSSKDPQVNQVWVYLFGGFLDTYYRFAVIAASANQGMTIDELTNPTGSNFNTKSKRTRLSTWGFTKITGGDATQSDITFTIRMSELEAIIENETLEPGAVGPPDHVVAITGPFNNRMFVLTEEGRMYPSSQDSPSIFSLYHHLDLRRYGDPLWAVLTSGGIYVGMTKDIIRIGGTGDESEDHVSADLFPEPLNIGNPPVDRAVVTDGNSVVYRSSDGLMLLTGKTLAPLGLNGVSLLWKSQDRHGIEALNTSYGRFRLAIDNHTLYMMAPEGRSYDPPGDESETLEWESLFGFEEEEGVLTKTAASGAQTSAVAERVLRSGDGYVEAVAVQVDKRAILGLCISEPQGLVTNITFGVDLRATGDVRPVVDGVPQINLGAYQVGDVFRVEIRNGAVIITQNDLVIYTFQKTLVYPLVPGVFISAPDASLGPMFLGGNWVLVNNSTDTLWRYHLLKQQWSRTPYPFNIMSIHREFDGPLLVGDDSGTVHQIEEGSQDEGADIGVDLLTPIDDGGDPLARKDPLDCQIHADTGARDGTVAFFMDGANTNSDPTEELVFNCDGPQVYRMNALDLGVFLKAQVRITGTFFKFLLHTFNLTYRNRVQQVMVLDVGTIQPQGNNRITWMTEADIDCIAPADLEVDVYLDDVLKATLSVVVKTGQRSIYRFELPKGSKAAAPRLVFRTTLPDGANNPGFEAYRVRIRDRGTGTRNEHGFRPVWPVGEAP